MVLVVAVACPFCAGLDFAIWFLSAFVGEYGLVFPFFCFYGLLKALWGQSLCFAIASFCF